MCHGGGGGGGGTKTDLDVRAGDKYRNSPIDCTWQETEELK